MATLNKPTRPEAFAQANDLVDSIIIYRVNGPYQQLIGAAKREDIHTSTLRRTNGRPHPIITAELLIENGHRKIVGLLVEKAYELLAEVDGSVPRDIRIEQTSVWVDRIAMTYQKVIYATLEELEKAKTSEERLTALYRLWSKGHGETIHAHTSTPFPNSTSSDLSKLSERFIGESHQAALRDAAGIARRPDTEEL